MTTLAAPAPSSRLRTALVLLVTSLAVTATTGLFAALIWAVAGGDYLLMFVYLRWSVVGVLLLIPVAWQLFGARMGVTLPYVVRTPLTALLLSCESIIVDIVSAKLH